jgi:AraC family L-rhamnose operon regulatory protein RhaS
VKNTQHRFGERPIFRIRNRQYEIDSCAPQNQAIESGKVRWYGLTKGHYPGTLMDQSILPGLKAVGFWDANGTPDWGEEPHRNEGVEIIFLESGSIGFKVDDQQYNLRPGEFMITRPWQLHKLGAPNIGPSLLHWLILDVGVRGPHQKWKWPDWIILTRKDLAQLTQKLRRNENPVWRATPAVIDSYRKVRQCINSWNQPRAVSHLVVNLNGLFLNIFEALSSQHLDKPPTITSPRQVVETFLKELRHNLKLSSQPWSKSKMAELCGLGTTTFSKCCRELVNSGPIEFLKLCRLEAAAKLLVEKRETPITDIAMQCGFNTSQYFSTCFRSQYKLAPHDFRKRKGGTDRNRRARLA